MTPNENLFMLILGLIGMLLGGTMLKSASRQKEPKMARRYRMRGTIYFVVGTALLTLVLLRSL